MLVMLVSTDIAFRTRKPVAICFGLALFGMRLGTTIASASVLSLIPIYALDLYEEAVKLGMQASTLLEEGIAAMDGEVEGESADGVADDAALDAVQDTACLLYTSLLLAHYTEQLYSLY